MPHLVKEQQIKKKLWGLIAQSQTITGTIFTLLQEWDENIWEEVEDELKEISGEAQQLTQEIQQICQEIKKITDSEEVNHQEHE